MALDVYADQVLRLSQVAGVVRMEYASLQPDEKMNTVAVPAVRVMMPLRGFLSALEDMQAFAARLNVKSAAAVGKTVKKAARPSAAKAKKKSTT